MKSSEADSLFGFLAAQPLLALTVLAVLTGTMGWRLQAASPRAGSVLRNVAYLTMVAVVLLTVVEMTRKTTRSDAAILIAQTPKVTVEGGETVVSMQPDGHFWVKAAINGHEQQFMIDTGATYVSLTRSAAAEAGISADPAGMPIELGTANGTMIARMGRADTLRFGSIEARGLEVVIAPDDAGDTNVIGMNLLSRLTSWRVEGRKLVLAPNLSQVENDAN